MSKAAPTEERVAFTVFTKKTKCDCGRGHSLTPSRLSNVHNFNMNQHRRDLQAWCGSVKCSPGPVHPPDQCCVLLAGTYDVAAGKQSIIFSRLEKIVKECCSSSALMVLSLPTRHDLPFDTPVHQTTALVNNYIVYPLRGCGNSGYQQHGCPPLYLTRSSPACK
ncbi:hypothetical protein J6590_009528 [Homalodisca vitripennis]|nr:hypothetical protein J6590_009528 [Homalodisca vitripennis]